MDEKIEDSIAKELCPFLLNYFHTITCKEEDNIESN